MATTDTINNFRKWVLDEDPEAYFRVGNYLLNIKRTDTTQILDLPSPRALLLANSEWTTHVKGLLSAIVREKPSLITIQYRNFMSTTVSYAVHVMDYDYGYPLVCRLALDTLFRSLHILHHAPRTYRKSLVIFGRAIGREEIVDKVRKSATGEGLTSLEKELMEAVYAEFYSACGQEVLYPTE